MTRRLSTRTTPLADPMLAIAWHSAALLLGYPHAGLLAKLDPLHRTSHRLPDEVGGPLRSTIVHLERAPLHQLQAEHAETFDVVRERDLLLAQPPYAPLALPAVGTARHLCFVLELAATATPGPGRHLLAGCRDGLERLRTALQEVESGWAGAVQAVTASLPPLADDA